MRRTLSIPDKLLFVLFIWTCAFLLDWQFNLALLVLTLLASFLLAPFRPVNEDGERYTRRFLTYSGVFVCVLVLVNGVLLREGTPVFTVSFLSLYSGGILYGLTVSTRLLLLSLSLLMFFVSVRLRDFVRVLESVGLPKPIVTIILLTAFFLEQLPHRIARVFTAQEARGAAVRAGLLSRSKALFVVLSPLVLSSIVESVERGVALELRGYHARPGPTTPTGELSANRA